MGKIVENQELKGEDKREHGVGSREGVKEEARE